ncbi:hypothetical protein A2U01_0029128, partial [Trifolium medium]|nr:hypothetical protein [Trifolium medium]
VCTAVGVQESTCREHCNSGLAYFKNCDGADETRGNVDCVKWTFNCIGLASCITFSY